MRSYRWVLFILAFLPMACEGRLQGQNCTRRLELVEKGRTCQPSCTSDDNCMNPLTCNCDDYCGMSCFALTAVCQPVPEPLNGRVYMHRVRPFYGIKVWFGCLPGFRLSSQEGRKCRSDRKWSGENPTCIPTKVCDDPPEPEHGYVTPTRFEWPFDSEAIYHCDEGFVFDLNVPIVKRRCGPDGEWTGELPKCMADPSEHRADGDCSSPPLLVNGNVVRESNYASDPPVLFPSSSTDWMVNDVALYRCRTGFQLVSGDVRRVCQWDGTWSGKQGRCVVSGQNPSRKVYCESPPGIANGVMQPDRNFGDLEKPPPTSLPDGVNIRPTLIEIRWRPDDVIVYICKSAYELVGGSKRRICKSDGSWTGTQPRCILKSSGTCANPTPPHGGFIVPQGKDRWQSGETYSVSCDSGFIPPIPNWATCLQSGTWMPEVLHCQAKHTFCPAPPNVANAVYSRTVGSSFQWTAGSVVTYRCSVGYVLVGGDGRVVCAPNGRWNGRMFRCQAKVRCGAPTAVNAEILPRGKTMWFGGDTFSVRCFAGYQPPSPNLSTCQPNGRWTSPSLACATPKRTCPAPPVLQNGFMQRLPTAQSSGWNPGDVVTYNCRPGYQLTGGSDRRVCTPGGTWSGTHPHCKAEVKCRQPTANNGLVMPQGKYSWYRGDTFYVRCHAGFTPPSPNLSTCLHNGAWSIATLSCGREVRCRSPAVQHGQVEPAGVSVWAIGRTFRARCRDGYAPPSPNLSTCQPNGAWSPPVLVCKKKQAIGPTFCMSPPRIDNGFIETDRNVDQGVASQSQAAPNRRVVTWPIGHVIMYSCKDGYQLEGGSIRRVCSSDGSWTGAAPRCKSVRTGQATGEWRTLSNGISYLSTTRRGSFDAAISECRNLGGLLVASSITKGSTLSELTSTLKPGQTYWIGLTDRAIESDWKWLDNTRMHFSELSRRFDTEDIWVSDKDCAVITMDSSRKWKADNCNYGNHLAICQRGSISVGSRSAIDEIDDAQPEFEDEAFVVFPIHIETNETMPEAVTANACQPNPCLNGCVCETSVQYGYLCKNTGPEQYLGSNCEYDAPTVECGEDAIEIKIASDVISDMDAGMGNGVAFLAPDEETAEDLASIDETCRFLQSDHSLLIFVLFPFDSCGTASGASGEGRIAFNNTIWFGRDFSDGVGASVYSPLARFSCVYRDFYQMTTTIDAVCCPMPPIVTSTGIFKFTSTLWNDPPGEDGSDILPSGRHRGRVQSADGVVSYKVGEMLYITVEMSSNSVESDSLNPTLKRCWLSPSLASGLPLPGRDLLLYPTSGSTVKTFGPISTALAVHFGFQLIRSKTSRVYLHCAIQVVSRRTRRDLSEERLLGHRVSMLTKGPIVLVAPPTMDASVEGSEKTYDLTWHHFLVGISVFGVTVIILMVGCCLADLRRLHGRTFDPNGNLPHDSTPSHRSRLSSVSTISSTVK